MLIILTRDPNLSVINQKILKEISHPKARRKRLRMGIRMGTTQTTGAKIVEVENSEVLMPPQVMMNPQKMKNNARALKSLSASKEM
jgi:hypothetical protein